MFIESMTLSRLFSDWMRLAMLLFAVAILFPACSEKVEPARLDMASFNSAPAEIKESWKAAAGWASKRNYLGAVTNMLVVFSNSQKLTPEQNADLNRAWQELGNKAFEAGNKGDKTSVEAFLKMRDSGFGREPGGR
jgi:hypothetical protein